MRHIEFILVVFNGMIILSDVIGGEAIKGFEDLGCGGMGSITVFGVELERRMFSLSEALADEAFQQCLDHQGDKEEEHIGLNPADLFKKQRGATVNAFELSEAFLQSRLELVGLKDFFWRDGRVRAHQRENSIDPGFAE